MVQDTLLANTQLITNCPDALWQTIINRNSRKYQLYSMMASHYLVLDQDEAEKSEC